MKSAKFTLPAASAVLLLACLAGLPPSLRQDIADEHDRLHNAAQEVDRSKEAADQKIAAYPDLFRAASTPTRWAAGFAAARETLHTAEETDRDLNQLAARNRAENRAQAENLLAKERSLRRQALDESETAVAAIGRWLNFRRDLPANLQKMQQEYARLHTTTLEPLSATVNKAEQDWPAKKAALETRLDRIRAVQVNAENGWDHSAADRQQASTSNLTDPQLAALIETDDTLVDAQQAIDRQSNDLRTSSAQLYDSWDKILVDLDKPRNDAGQAYRERIRTIRTHLADVVSKQSETSSSEQWVPVSESTFSSVENDLGMSLAHKDAGLFDSEAVDIPQPAGFAYIAPESQGSNQYGYWTHDGGHSVWTWLPQYLLLRELLWNHSYRPVVLDEYRGFRMAQQVGRTYYGSPTPAAPPKYGTHGSFTRTSYASSSYVQSGGYRQSAYASRGGFGKSPGETHQSPSFADPHAGHRFGSGGSHSPSGRHFGGSRGAGRGFGRHR